MYKTKNKKTNIILIVDDSVDIADFLELELAKRGYKVNVALNGYDGLEKIKEEEPDLVILDINMPVLTGLEMLERLHKRNSNMSMPVLFFPSSCDVNSGYTESLGAIDCISKSKVNYKNFFQCIEKIISREKVS